ncbi:MAG TPA: DUF1501 domain-containing protein [Gemmataceae bacterium]|nr:DUF1501 domain-containing protein [Gemmataceae bacterium]
MFVPPGRSVFVPAPRIAVGRPAGRVTLVGVRTLIAALGRDHWPQCGFGLLTGGDVKAGMVYSATGKQAAYRVSDPVSPANLVATIYQLLRIGPHLTVTDRIGRPIVITCGGESMKGVLT